ncbi:MAG: ABC transporter permease subunit [Burkholderiales bacterium]|nr:ABC transporter permease subunit [Burkholderiales bacterium]
MDLAFMLDTTRQLLGGVPMLLELAVWSVAAGVLVAILIASMRESEHLMLNWIARAYVVVFRGTPLLVLLFLIYYGLGQFAFVRGSFLWPLLREPYWCALLAFILNSSASGSEIVRGSLQAVPFGAIEAARACGMSRFLLLRRIVFPIALRFALPTYSSETILMVKATSLASIVTLMEVTGIASKLISTTYRVMEIFICAGAIYLVIVFLVTRAFIALEFWLSPHLRDAAPQREPKRLAATLP